MNYTYIVLFYCLSLTDQFYAATLEEAYNNFVKNSNFATYIQWKETYKSVKNPNAEQRKQHIFIMAQGFELLPNSDNLQNWLNAYNALTDQKLKKESLDSFTAIADSMISGDLQQKARILSSKLYANEKVDSLDQLVVPAPPVEVFPLSRRAKPETPKKPLRPMGPAGRRLPSKITVANSLQNLTYSFNNLSLRLQAVR